MTRQEENNEKRNKIEKEQPQIEELLSNNSIRIFHISVNLVSQGSVVLIVN